MGLFRRRFFVSTKLHNEQLDLSTSAERTGSNIACTLVTIMREFHRVLGTSSAIPNAVVCSKNVTQYHWKTQNW